MVLALKICGLGQDGGHHTNSLLEWKFCPRKKWVRTLVSGPSLPLLLQGTNHINVWARFFIKDCFLRSLLRQTSIELESSLSKDPKILSLNKVWEKGIAFSICIDNLLHVDSTTKSTFSIPEGCDLVGCTECLFEMQRSHYEPFRHCSKMASFLFAFCSAKLSL